MNGTAHKTIALILAGGMGARLHPLTADRAKPAVPFGGKYRIIDFTLSNCLHSGLRRILVLTQYKSHSLQKHLRDGWSIFNPGLGEYITPLPPQMRTGESWYRGTADAVFQSLFVIERSDAENVVILAGDHVYRMDYAAMLARHRQTDADVTVACMRVPVDQASAFGVLSVDEDSWVQSFAEKPEDPAPIPDAPDSALASMGVYVFKKDFLSEVLVEDSQRPDSSHDFGKDVLPRLIRSKKVLGYSFGGEFGRVSSDRYWRDVGNIDAYYAANMDRLLPVPPMDLYQSDWNIHTFERSSPPARAVDGESGHHARIENSIVSSGVIVSGGVVRNSVLSPGVRVDDRALVENAILFSGVEVGKGACLKNCIVDKHVIIPTGECIGLDRSQDERRFTRSPGGIAVVPRNFNFETAGVRV